MKTITACEENRFGLVVAVQIDGGKFFEPIPEQHRCRQSELKTKPLGVDKSGKVVEGGESPFVVPSIEAVPVNPA